MKKLVTILCIALCIFIMNITHSKAIEGIDVSAWQGSIDFDSVKNDGIEIVYIRSSAGNSYVDEYFMTNYENAKEYGLKVGFYHYVTARNVSEAKEQAIFFANTIAGLNADCRLAMDFEVFTGLSNEEVNNISKVFLETLKEKTNKELVIYSDAYNANNVFSKRLFDEYPLWVAEYDASYPSASPYIGWQYTDTGKIQGINGNVDRDTFDETIYLSDKTTIEKPKLSDEEKNKTIYYRVKFGNTLSQIAKMYNVTLDDILRENNIKNPNLIYPNEVIKINTSFDYNVSNEGNNEYYKVKPGNTLTYIAYKYKVLVSNLVTWNNIKNPNLIYPNEEILIKPHTNDHLIKYIVQPNDTLSKIAQDFDASVFEIALINKIMNPNYIFVGEILYIPDTYSYEK